MFEEPSSYQEVASQATWREAMEEEIEVIVRYDTWILTPATKELRAHWS